VKTLTAILLALVLPVLAVSCSWLNPGEIICTEHGDASCPEGSYCSPTLGDNNQHYCDGVTESAYDPPAADDDDFGDDDSGDDDSGDDDSGDDDSGDDDSGDDDDSVGGPVYQWVQWSSLTQVNGPLNSVSFPTLEQGWAVGVDGVILHSEDSGESWYLQNTDAGGTPTFQQELTSVSFLDENNGWITAVNGQVLTTTDGGVHWDISSWSAGAQLNSIHAKAADQVYTVGGQAGEGVAHTYDGLNWTMLATYPHPLNAITSNPATTTAQFWAVGDSGYFAMNGELSNTSHILGPDLNGVAAISDVDAWAVGDAGRLVFTWSAGAKWVERASLIPAMTLDGGTLQASEVDWYDIEFTGTDYGWIAGKNGMIVRTTNGGGDWFQDTYRNHDDPMRPNLNNQHIRDIEFHDTVAGWAVGDGALILRTVPIGSSGDDDAGDDDASGDDTSSPCPDGDGDNYTPESCSICPAGGSDNDCGDCDDNDATVSPAASDTAANGVDNNCDGVPGVDDDGDGYASTASGGDDCDDNNAAVSPGAVEYCDAIDSNCNGSLVDGFTDTDVDGSPACQDCDDNNAAIHPGATEACNGLNDTCTGPPPGDEVDDDSDGYVTCCPWIGTDSSIYGGCDCDDNPVTGGDSFPGNVEVCDAIDNDCLGGVDDGFDADGDGFFTEADSGCVASYTTTDCDDADHIVHPGASEICDGIDNDCNGDIDEADPGLDTSTYLVWYLDDDGDGYGEPTTAILACSQPAGYVANDSDCDDNQAAIHPGATEACNGLNDTCTGPPPSDEVDDDSDGYVTCCPWIGTDSSIYGGCDCNDQDGNNFPGNPENCSDGLDNDCDQAIDQVDTDCGGGSSGVDADNDNFDSILSGGTDCNDLDDDVHPGAWDSLGGIDQDCNLDINTTGAAGSAVGFLSECAGSGVGNFSFTVAPGGDFDGNTVPDLVFGSPNWRSGCGAANNAQGRTYVWRSQLAPFAGSNPNPPGDPLPVFGASSQLGTAGAYLTGPAGTGYSGASVAMDGDINGDGYNDLLIGVPNHLIGATGGPIAGGAVYLVLGGATTSGNTMSPNTQWITPNSAGSSDLSVVNADFTFYGSTPDEKAGQTVTWAGDVNGDGYDEILIGAPGFESGRGKVYLLDGLAIADSLNGSGSPITCSDPLGSPQQNCRNLYSTIPAGSMNTFTGKVGVQEELGAVVAAGRDLTGDDKADFALGSASGNSQMGTVFVFFSDILSPDSTQSPPAGAPDHWGDYGNGDFASENRDFEIQGVETGGHFGESVAMIPDLPGDTVIGAQSETAELLIGQPEGTLAKVFVVLGSEIIAYAGSNITDIAAELIASITFTGDPAGDGLGYALAGGDVDGDLAGDILLCAPMTTGAGRGYLYYGDALVSSVTSRTLGDADHIFVGEGGTDFCSSVVFPGDVDGFGSGDLLIGAAGWSNGVGKAYLFLSP
jgi:photosystem II stability/assembly factor-like uncharacterized protein